MDFFEFLEGFTKSFDQNFMGQGRTRIFKGQKWNQGHHVLVDFGRFFGEGSIKNQRQKISWNQNKHFRTFKTWRYSMKTLKFGLRLKIWLCWRHFKIQNLNKPSISKIERELKNLERKFKWTMIWTLISRKKYSVAVR